MFLSSCTGREALETRFTILEKVLTVSKTPFVPQGTSGTKLMVGLFIILDISLLLYGEVCLVGGFEIIPYLS